MSRLLKYFGVYCGILFVFISTVFPKDGEVKMQRYLLVSQQISKAQTTNELAKTKNHIKEISQVEQKLIENLKVQSTTDKIKKEITLHSRPDVLVPTFLKQLQQQDVSALALANEYEQNITFDVGTISGTVTVEGNVPDSPVIMLAFDDHGYFAGIDTVSNQDGSYEIETTSGDSFYVLTLSRHYIDELYDDVKAPLSSLETWRQAQKVVTNQANVNFDLETGAFIAGTIFNEDGVTPVDNNYATIVLFRADQPIPLYEEIVDLENGKYDSVGVPVLGDFKAVAYAEGYNLSWHTQQQTWEAADVISINSYDDYLTNVNFNMAAIPEEELTGGVTGKISVKGGFVPMPAFLSVIAAFDVADSSFAGLGLGILGAYEINGLAEGEYYIYANDYTGSLLGTGNFLGEYFSDAYSIGEAQPVTVNAGVLTEDIDFVLEPGASITGTVTDEFGQPLDSLMVVAINNVLSDSTGEPFLANMQIGAAVTNTDGEYEITGLQTGDYYLRTISSFVLNPDLASLMDGGELIMQGKHAENVVDEYYGGVHNILKINESTKVSVVVPEETANINFSLDAARFISGKVTIAQNGAPFSDLIIVALDTTSGFPYLPWAQIEDDGNYVLGPLPTGDYKLLALPGSEGGIEYLPEFYNNKRTFENATVLQLNGPVLTGIDIALDQGATIQGFVSLAKQAQEVYAGADTLYGFPVVIYDAVTGALASYDWVQFNGGYRVSNLVPGDYKIAAIPMPSDFATTYYGGGNTFNDALNQIVTVNYGDVKDIDLTLTQATGSIQGHITHRQTGAALSMIMVVAYDASGHPVGFAFSDYDVLKEISLSETGQYLISGLNPGTYYIRTVAMTSLIQASALLNMVTGFSEGFDLASILGDGLDFSEFSLNVFKDYWYKNVPAAMNFDIQQFLFGLSSYGTPNDFDTSMLPYYLPLPFSEEIPPMAQGVQVYSNASTTDIDIMVEDGSIDDILPTDVENSETTQIPEKFTLYQNYPNPFNPTTTISFSVPQVQNVSISIFNALGRYVKTIDNQRFQAGTHYVQWDGKDNNGLTVAAGIYFARIQADNFDKTIKMLLVK